MKVEIKIPEMGESISEVTIGDIFKENGKELKADEELLEIETDKVNQSLFAAASGILTLNVSKGDVVKVGQVIGLIELGDSISKQEVKEKQNKQEENKQEENKQEEKTQPQKQVESQAIEKLPLKKEEKKESDVLPKKEHLSKETRKPLTQIRKVIGRKLLEAEQERVSVTTFNEVDMSQIISLREHYQELFMKEHSVKLGFLSFFIKAAVASLKAFPVINSYIEEDEIVTRHDYAIGIAVATDKGLFVPVVKDCETLSFSAIELKIADYAKKAREGKISVDDLTGGSFTITNGGVYGSLFSTPIINPPQSAILGMHKIMKRAVVIDDQIVIRPMMYVALSYDHRLIDGKEAVSFLVTLKEHLEEPSRLLIDL